MNKEQIIDAIKEMTVLELNELVKACEEEFGVSAAAPVVMAAGGGEAAAEEKLNLMLFLQMQALRRLALSRLLEKLLV